MNGVYRAFERRMSKARGGVTPGDVERAAGLLIGVTGMGTELVQTEEDEDQSAEQVQEQPNESNRPDTEAAAQTVKELTVCMRHLKRAAYALCDAANAVQDLDAALKNEGGDTDLYFAKLVETLPGWAKAVRRIYPPILLGEMFMMFRDELHRVQAALVDKGIVL